MVISIVPSKTGNRKSIHVWRKVVGLKLSDIFVIMYSNCCAERHQVWKSDLMNDKLQFGFLLQETAGIRTFLGFFI